MTAATPSERATKREADLEEALAACIPWVATSARGAAQEALAIACYLTGSNPYDWTHHPDVLEPRIALLPARMRRQLERRAVVLSGRPPQTTSPHKEKD